MAEKRKSGCLKGFIVFLFVTAIVVYAIIEFGGISLNDPLVRMIQLSSPPGKTVRLEKAFRKYFASPRWESIVATDGNKYVNFRGKAFYGEKIEEYALQFFVGEDNGVSFWKLTAIEVGGNPMHAAFFGNQLIDKVYEEFK